MAPKHEKGNTTGDHDAADARVRRARALYASISSISVLDFCYVGSIVLCRSERARARVLEGQRMPYTAQLGSCSVLLAVREHLGFRV